MKQKHIVCPFCGGPLPCPYCLPPEKYKESVIIKKVEEKKLKEPKIVVEKKPITKDKEK